MISRRTLLRGIAGGLLCVPLRGIAQPQPKVRRIGLLSPGSKAGPVQVNELFRERLRELGWIEGQNYVIDYRFAEYRHERLPELAADLVRNGAEIIVAPATPAAVAAKNATSTIPIVIVGVGDPVGSGLVASLAHPGGNITGITYSAGSMDIYGKELELLTQAVPKVRRVAVLSNPGNAAHPLWMQQIQRAGASLGVEVRLFEVRDPSEFDAAFAAIAKERAGALLVVADSLFTLHRTKLVELATKRKLPTVGYADLVTAGAFMSYGPSLASFGRGSADYVDRILKGALPGDMPIEQPSKLELVINLRAAKALGIVVPQSLLVRADQVIR